MAQQTLAGILGGGGTSSSQRPAEKGGGWRYVKRAGFARGLDTQYAEGATPDGFVLQADNVRVVRGNVLRDHGYSAYLNTMRGIPQLFQVWTSRAGTDYLLVVTTVSVYVRQAGEWRYVKDGDASATTTTASAAAGATSVTVASIAGFSDNDYIAIELASGLQHRTQVNGAPAGSTITFDDAIPVGQSVANGAAVYHAVTLAGSTATPVCGVAWESDDWFVFTNGVDTPRKFNGSASTALTGLTYVATDTYEIESCRWLLVANEQLLMFDTTENINSGSSTRHRTRIRRSDTGDGATWNHTTGNAGYADAVNAMGTIQNAHIVNGTIGVLFDNGLGRYDYVGAASLLYRFTPVVTGEGCVGPLAAYATPAQITFLGNTDVWTWDGGGTLTALGRAGPDARSAVQQTLYGERGELSLTSRARAVVHHFDTRNETWVMYPRGTAGLCDTMLRYNHQHNTWTRRTFADYVYSAGKRIEADGLDWSDLVGYWDAQDVWWSALSADVPVTRVLLCDASASPGKVYNYAQQYGTDDGTDISWTVATDDVFEPEARLRLDFVEGIANGAAITVEYSIDGGLGWSTYGTTSAASTMTKWRIYKQISAAQIRFRFSGTGASTLGWWAYRALPESIK